MSVRAQESNVKAPVSIPPLPPLPDTNEVKLLKDSLKVSDENNRKLYKVRISKYNQLQNEIDRIQSLVKLPAIEKPEEPKVNIIITAPEPTIQKTGWRFNPFKIFKKKKSKR